MDEPNEAIPFGALLRRHRAAAGLTQEELAEQAGLSRRGIADLERGARQTPYADTVERLASALGLSRVERDRLVAAARGRKPDLAGVETTTIEPREALAANPLYRRVFVGRDAELRQLQAVCDRACAGNGELALVVGEPGVGKTAVCGQLAAYATSHGMACLAGHLYEEGFASVPYLPFVEMLRAYVLERSVDQLRNELGGLAPDVGRIVPEVCEKLHLEPRPTRDPEEDRWRLLNSVADFLRTVSSARPLMLILEDLQWADRGTLDLLLFLSRRLAGTKLLVVGTYRDVEVDRAHPLAAGLAELPRGPEFTRVPIRGLKADDVRHMLQILVGEEVGASLAAAVHEQTEGNPLFVQEVARYMVEEGLIDQWRADSPGTLARRVPEGVRDVISKRLSKLSTVCNKALSAAAVIGRDFGLSTLQQVTDLDEDALLEALEQAQRMRVLDDVSVHGEVRFRFNHALFRQTLYEELFTPRRLQLHQRVARVLEEQYKSQLEEHAAELSEHFAQSSDTTELDKARQYAELAAARAQRVSAYGEAVRYFRSALHLVDIIGGDSLEKRCDLLLALGQTMISAGEGAGVADQVAPEAFRLAEGLRDGRRRAFDACILGVNALVSQYGFLASERPDLRTWEERIDRVAAPDSAERIQADGILAFGLRAEGSEAAARQLDLRAINLARRLGEMRRATTQPIEGWTVPPHRQRERLELANELEPTLPESLAGRRVLSAFHLGDVHLTWGDRQRTEALWGTVVDLAAQVRLPLATLLAQRTKLLLACLDGQLEQAIAARSSVEQAGEAVGAGPFGRASVAIYQRRTLLYLGHAEQALSGFSQELVQTQPAQVPVFGTPGVFAAQLGLCLAYVGRTTEPRQIVQRFLSARTIGEADDETPMPIVVALLETAVALGDTATTRLLVEPLKIAADLVVVDNTMTVVGRHLGAAMALLDDRERAQAYTRQAIEVAEKVRFRPEVALARLQLAEFFGAPPDDSLIVELESMHMQPALTRARALRG